MILFGAFGGLISERVTLEENPKFTASFLGGKFVLCILPFLGWCLAAYKWSNIHKISTIFLYILLVITLALDVVLFFLPPVHCVFESGEEWPDIQILVENTMNMSVPFIIMEQLVFFGTKSRSTWHAVV